VLRIITQGLGILVRFWHNVSDEKDYQMKADGMSGTNKTHGAYEERRYFSRKTEWEEMTYEMMHCYVLLWECNSLV
jgi:hypothetical protein